MIRSMTGFGKAQCDYGDSVVSIELSTVNHRYLDASVRLPYEWASAEQALREVVKEHLSRGKLNLNVNRKRNSGAPQAVQLDKDVAQQYVDAARELGQLVGDEVPLSLDALAQFPGVFAQQEEEEDLDQAQSMLSGLLIDALERLNAMRDVEGQKLGEELSHRVQVLRDTVEEVEQRLPELKELYKARLQERIQELVEDTAVAEERVAMEVAIISDKADVTEEIVRLKSHLDHAEEMMHSDEACGRQLNFLTQEVQREINTLGSKVRDTEVVRHVLAMKSELEKFREQIQNVE